MVLIIRFLHLMVSYIAKMSQKYNCSFAAWYPNFKQVTIESTILALPKDVLKYLMSDDSLVLPADETKGVTSNDDKNDLDSNDDWDTSSPAVVAPDFTEFKTVVDNAIFDVGRIRHAKTRTENIRKMPHGSVLIRQCDVER